ncbi:MAG: nuclease-related domain-containing protein [Proteobacteria bacterium]|nr:nuclease-related domain-containing protein [Pseudomonadota bacterium]
MDANSPVKTPNGTTSCIMTDLLPADFSAAWMLPAGLLALLISWLVIRSRRGRVRTLESVLDAISFEHIQGLVIPKADEGEIQIDHLILTAQGLLIIEVKDVQGTVFGSDKMQDWTVISDENRFTFSNPQPALYDRIAAVRQIVRQVPVAGRIVFLDGAKFTKGVPKLVCNLDELYAEFGELDKSAAKVKIEAFIPHWEQIQNRVK